jgi:hypothetical protein
MTTGLADFASLIVALIKVQNLISNRQHNEVKNVLCFYHSPLWDQERD